MIGLKDIIPAAQAMAEALGAKPSTGLLSAGALVFDGLVNAVRSFGMQATPEERAEIEQALEDLAAKVNVTAEETIARLRGK